MPHRDSISYGFLMRPLRLRDANGLAGHEAAVNHEQKNRRVKLESGALEPDTEGKVVVNPALRQPVGHDSIHTERSRNRSSLEVLALASLVLGQDGNSDVEASETGETAKNEKGKTESVGDGSETKGESDHSGGDTERDLVLRLGLKIGTKTA